MSIREEYKKCLDPVYFIDNYIFVNDPVLGVKRFRPHLFQDDIVDVIGSKDTILLKSRQMGISTLFSSYALWLSTFHSDKHCFCVSPNLPMSVCFMEKVRFSYNQLPEWLRCPCVCDNKFKLEFKNGSKIISTSSNKHDTCGESIDLLLIDEASFITNLRDYLINTNSALTTNGRIVISGTKIEEENQFYDMWTDSLCGNNKFLPFCLPWILHPERDVDWRKRQTDILGKECSLREYDCV